MGVAYLNGKVGVWRTVGGRKIFIANGQSLRDAMKASGKFKNLKDDKDNKNKVKSKIKGIKDTPQDMDTDDIRAEITANELKMKTASSQERTKIMLRNHSLRMELDRRWGEDERKYKEQQKQKQKNSAKAALVDAEADFKFAQKNYPEDHTEYKQALKNYKQAIDDYEYAGGKVADSKKAKLGNDQDDSAYKKAILTDAAADWNYVKDNYPEGSKQYQRAKEAYDRALYDVNGKEIQLKGGDKTKYKVLDEATDSMGEKIYKVMEDGQEKWVQGEHFNEISSKSPAKKVTTIANGADGKAINFDRKHSTFKYNGTYDDNILSLAKSDTKKVEDLGRKVIADIDAGKITTKDQLSNALNYGSYMDSKENHILTAGGGYYNISNHNMWRDTLYNTDAEKELSNQMKYWRLKAEKKFNVGNMSISELSQRYMEQGYSKETARAMAREDIQNSK